MSQGQEWDRPRNSNFCAMLSRERKTRRIWSRSCLGTNGKEATTQKQSNVLQGEWIWGRGTISKVRGERNLKGFVVHFSARGHVKAPSLSLLSYSVRLPCSNPHEATPRFWSPLSAYWIITGAQPSSLPSSSALWRSRIQSDISIVGSIPHPQFLLKLILISSCWDNLDFPSVGGLNAWPWSPEWPCDLCDATGPSLFSINATSPLTDNPKSSPS